jgi:tight adherence protein B
VILVVLAAVTAVVVWPGGALVSPLRALPGARRTFPGATRDHIRGSRWQPVLLARATRWRARRAGSELDELADLLEVMVPALRAGASVPTAVGLAGRVAGRDGHLDELVAELVRSAGRGERLAAVWAAAAASSDTPGLDFVARAWALSEQTGTPLSAALATAARSLRARRAADQALVASTAGARASMTLLALLPATGPAIGLLFGLSPVDLYGSSPASALSLLAGVVMGAAGWLWSRSILRRALRPASVGAR